MNKYKAQYKTSPSSSWQTRTSGNEQSCFQVLANLRNQYPFARVIDQDGRVVS